MAVVTAEAAEFVAMAGAVTRPKQQYADAPVADLLPVLHMKHDRALPRSIRRKNPPRRHLSKPKPDHLKEAGEWQGTIRSLFTCRRSLVGMAQMFAGVQP